MSVSENLAMVENSRQAIRRRADRTAVAEAIIEEMARRQGHRHGPYFEWNLATEQFLSRFNDLWAPASLQLSAESVEQFVRGFVDGWPEGLAALRVVPDPLDPIANPPYSTGGLWPAFLRRTKQQV